MWLPFYSFSRLIDVSRARYLRDCFLSDSFMNNSFVEFPNSTRHVEVKINVDRADMGVTRARDDL